MNAPQPTSRVRKRAVDRAALLTPDQAASARTRAGLELEESLEAYMRRCVRAQLGGIYIKLLPGIVKGIPDRLILLPGGRIRFVELKRLGERPSPRQLIVHAQWAELGIIVDVVTGRADIDRWVREQYPTTQELDRAARARKQSR